jgi:ribA/ribD-fused uncharacterized protein
MSYLADSIPAMAASSVSSSSVSSTSVSSTSVSSTSVSSTSVSPPPDRPEPLSSDALGDRLYFFSNSADVPPGQGVHERVGDPGPYAALSAVRHWRRMLSNFWPADFRLGERTYRTVEHAFQAAKIALVSAELAEQFTLESGTPLAQGDGAVARKHRKIALLGDEQLRRWSEIKHAVMRDAMRAKFGEHRALQAVLVATAPAELWHGFGRGSSPMRMRDLEEVRAALES